MQQGICHVIAVADIGELQAFQRTLMLLDGQKVRQYLCRMLVIGKTVDDRNRTVLRKIDDVLMVKSSDHDTIYHSRENVSSIVDGFATSDLDVIGRKEERMSAELVHTDLKRDTGSCGRFGEDHAEGLSGQDRVRDARFCLRLEIDRGIQKCVELRDGYVFVKIDIVFHMCLLLSLKDILQCRDEFVDLCFVDDQRRCDTDHICSDGADEEAFLEELHLYIGGRIGCELDTDEKSLATYFGDLLRFLAELFELFLGKSTQLGDIFQKFL